MIIIKMKSRIQKIETIGKNCSECLVIKLENGQNIFATKNHKINRKLAENLKKHVMANVGDSLSVKEGSKVSNIAKVGASQA